MIGYDLLLKRDDSNTGQFPCTISLEMCLNIQEHGRPYDDYHNNNWHCARVMYQYFCDCFLYVKMLQHEVGLMLRLVRTDRGRQG